MKLYQKNGYVDIRAILKNGLPFNFVVGGRATGKTYTSLKTVVEDGVKFLFMRRTQSQADLINKPEFSPFKSLNRDLGLDVKSKPITKYNAGFYDGDNSEPIGYTAALSTISNMRGFDASDVELLIYDEFIPEVHERPLKNEGAAFFNAYETVNRNRELSGRKPLQVLCLANANDITNPIFVELGLVSKAETMLRRGQEYSIDKRRGVGVYMLNNSPISKVKRDTALYKLTSGTEFSRMSLDNSFTEIENTQSKSRPIVEYKPLVRIGELTIYQHKSNGRLYVSTHMSGSCTTYTASPNDLDRFNRAFGWVRVEQLENNVDYEESFCEILLTKYLK